VTWSIAVREWSDLRVMRLRVTLNFTMSCVLLMMLTCASPGFNLANAQVDSAFVEMCSRMRVAPEQLTKSLEAQGIRLDTLKKRIKADMARASLGQLRYYKFEDRPLGR
jgi:hypothetical protein